MSRIGEKIQKIRNEKGISAKQLAKKLGVAEKFITEVELGRKVMNENLIEKASKVLGEDLNDLTMNFKEEENDEIKVVNRKLGITKEKEVSAVWGEAFSSILKAIPVYDYSLNKVLGKKTLPLISNKIDGHSQDKVLFLAIQDDDMIGFRIAKGDIAFGHTINEVENNSVCLLEHKGERVVRQIKKLDNNKVLLISNRGNVITETAEIKNIKPLVKIDKVEIIL